MNQTYSQRLHVPEFGTFEVEISYSPGTDDQTAGNSDSWAKGDPPEAEIVGRVHWFDRTDADGEPLKPWRGPARYLLPEVAIELRDHVEILVEAGGWPS